MTTNLFVDEQINREFPMKGFPMPATTLPAFSLTAFRKIALIFCCTVLMMFVAGSTAASAQSGCPTSPNYSPDFSNVSNQACLTLNGTNNGTPITAPPGPPGFYPVVTPPTPPPVVATVLRLTPNQAYWAGSAWYKTQQPVAGAFSTTFTFELTGSNTGFGPADGIAFVIQNSPAGTGALGPDGCGIGFGGGSCTPGSGIPNSLAVEFNTFQNIGIDPSNSDVTIQNCSGTGANSVDPTCSIKVNDLTHLTSPINMADGNVHTVEITYSGPGTKLLDVILDGNDLFPGGVFFDMTTISLNSGNAWVGFTAATGGGDDNQDILSWTFTPGAQTIVVSQNTLAVASFPNAAGNNVYDYSAQLTAPYTGNPAVTIQPILMTPAACNALVQKNFWPARCFVYANAENSGMDASVLFAVTCSNGPCGSNASPFYALLGTDFEFLASENPFFVYPGIAGFLNPFPGWLKGSGPYPNNPCIAPPSGPLFLSNQVGSFIIDGGRTVGNSGGGASCWVATYDTPGEKPPGIKITSPTPFAKYSKGSVVPATYACNNPSTSQPTSNPTGPYLTAASCKQNSGTPASCTFTPPPGGGQSCTGGTVDTSSKGLHAFVVTAIDSGQNQNLQIVPYIVK